MTVHRTGRHTGTGPTPSRRGSAAPRSAPRLSGPDPADRRGDVRDGDRGPERGPDRLTDREPRQGGAGDRPGPASSGLGSGRRITAGVLAGLLAVGAVLAAAAGLASCNAAGEASSGVQAVRDLVQRMESARLHTYTAEYATAGGVAVVHAQTPPRVAYRSAAGSYVLGPDVAVRCRLAETPARCDRAPGSDGVPLSHTGLIAAAVGTAFVPAEAAAAALSRAAGQADARVTTHGRVVATLRTRCVRVTTGQGGGLRLTACVTDGGLLAFFEGTGAARVRMELVRSARTAEPTAFESPRDARVAEVDTLAP
jgi:hypothetical protein